MNKCLSVMLVTGHGSNGSTVYAGLDTKTGDLVAIAEWVLKWRHIPRRKQTETRLEGDKEAETYQKQVQNVPSCKKNGLLFFNTV